MPVNISQSGYGRDIDGWLVERKVVSQEAVVSVPDNLSYEEGSTLPCAAVTAWSALTGGMAIRAGHTVLVQGTGGVSIFALQLAKAVGASVIATTSSAAKANRLRALRADEVVNYKEEPHWSERVRALTGARGVDPALEVGGAWDDSCAAPMKHSESAYPTTASACRSAAPTRRRGYGTFTLWPNSSF
jgi:NADPH:quinone reductase-like Zn-dependent oxidoreductase